MVDLDGKYVSDPKIKETLKEKVEDVLVRGKDLTDEIFALEKKYLQANTKAIKLPSPFPPSVEVYHELSYTEQSLKFKPKTKLLYSLKLLSLSPTRALILALLVSLQKEVLLWILSILKTSISMNPLTLLIC